MEITFYILGGVVAGGLLGFLAAKVMQKDDPRAGLLQQEVERLRGEIEGKEILLRQAGERSAALETRSSGLAEQLIQHKKDMAELQEQMRLQFGSLARQIFEENANRFTEQSQKGLGDLLNPLKERLVEFQAHVNKSFGDQAKEQFALKSEIERIVKVSQTMSVQTENLTRALKGDVKAQGNWGEVMLERILEASGLRAGIDYTTQAEALGLKNAEGQVQKPDVIVHLPEKRHVIIDAKVSLTHYERYVGEADEAARMVHFRQFMDSLRAHVKGLSEKRYEQLTQLGTPDFVLMFLPVEGAYTLAVQDDPQLHAYAWERKIVLVCPSTLFATVKTIASIWRMELQSQNAIKIAQESGALYDKFVGFIGDMEDIGAHIGKTQKTYDLALRKLKEGPGNLVRKAEQLKIMGAKTAKSLPVELVADAGEDAPLLLKNTGS